ncbi:hypothetical protein EV359DRAFT_69073 [Lentinula novae-zelandiae]|nr:hypothetical protein EV359DRAFT_69073 [Lentinula novae-zelandiae]
MYSKMWCDMHGAKICNLPQIVNIQELEGMNTFGFLGLKLLSGSVVPKCQGAWVDIGIIAPYSPTQPQRVVQFQPFPVSESSSGTVTLPNLPGVLAKAKITAWSPSSSFGPLRRVEGVSGADGAEDGGGEEEEFEEGGREEGKGEGEEEVPNPNPNNNDNDNTSPHHPPLRGADTNARAHLGEFVVEGGGSGAWRCSGLRRRW